MWNVRKLTELTRRLNTNSNKKSVAIAFAAVVGVETLRRTLEEQQQAKEQDEPTTLQSLADAPASFLNDVLPSGLQRLPSLTERADCEAGEAVRQWIPEHFSRPRRQGTAAKLSATADKEDLRSKYAIQWKKPLGEGTFGSVYLAKDRKTGERCAIKKIPKKFTDNVSFKREMDALLTLRDNGGHPHICGLRENYEEGDFYYLVLDLVSGGEMFDHLCIQGAYSEADAARVVREVASALSFMHGIGIVHGDMKPENLMLSSETATVAVIKVVDFGCAQVETEDGVGTMEKGSSRGSANTPAYSPPEILDKNRPDTIEPSFDMFALGVILYIMLTGVHPFDLYGNASDEEIESQILSRQKPPLRNSPLTAHLSPDAISVIEQLIDWDPSKRGTALNLLRNPWVRGETARTTKIADSDKRLSAYRAFKTKLEAKVFADMIAWSENSDDGNEVAKRTSLIERSFQMLNPDHRGYVTASDLRKLTGNTEDGADDKISLSGFSDLLAENMKNRYFNKGHIVYHEGDEGNVMYFINSGNIEVYTRDGLNKTVRKAGDFFGEGALMHPKKIRSASIRCVTPVHAIEINREYFEKYLATEEGAMVSLREKDRTRKRQRAKTILGLQSHMHEKVVKKGDYVFQKGKRGHDMFIVEEGQVDIVVDGHTVLTVEPGEMTGEHSLIMGRPRNVSTRCVSDECKLQVLPARDFYALLDLHPSLKGTIRDICLRREFQKALCFKIKRAFPRTETELREVFAAVGDSKSGVIEKEEIRSMIHEFDSTYSDEDISDIIRTLDLTDSGSVRWEDFKRIFGMNGEKPKSPSPSPPR